MSNLIFNKRATISILSEGGEQINEAANDFPVFQLINIVVIIVMGVILNLHQHSHDVSEPLHDHADCNHDHEIPDDVQSAKPKQSAQIIPIVIGFLLHDIVEGLSLGFMTELKSTINLFIGIALHKWCDTIVITIQSMKKDISTKQIVLFGLPVALATPIAQLIAFLITKFAISVNQMALGITQDIMLAITGGTFISLVFFEILHEELTKPKMLRTCLGLLLGVLIIVVTCIVEIVTSNEE